MSLTIAVEASHARPSTTGVDDGYDVDVCVTLPDGTEIDGEVTLLRRTWEVNSPWGAWGTPNNWLDGRTLASLRELDHDDYRDALDAIESAASAECPECP